MPERRERMRTMGQTERGGAAEALLSVRQVAELDGCSEKTVRRAIGTGLLEVVRIGPGGRLVRISPAAHRAYRKAHLG